MIDIYSSIFYILFTILIFYIYIYIYMCVCSVYFYLFLWIFGWLDFKVIPNILDIPKISIYTTQLEIKKRNNLIHTYIYIYIYI